MSIQPASNAGGYGVRAVLAAVSLSMLVGCTPYQFARRTLGHELAQYPRVTDGRLACRVYRAWARQAWAECGAESAFSAEYRRGFEDGFVDHVFAGGNGDPPPIPPRRFWNITYRSPEGDQAIQDWTAGFRHGASVALDGGYRKRTVVPSSLLGVPQETSARGYAANEGDFDQLQPTPAESPEGGLLEIPDPEPLSIPAANGDESELLPLDPSESDAAPVPSGTPDDDADPQPGDITDQLGPTIQLAGYGTSNGAPPPPWLSSENTTEGGPVAAGRLEAIGLESPTSDQTVTTMIDQPQPRSEWKPASSTIRTEPTSSLDSAQSQGHSNTNNPGLDATPSAEPTRPTLPALEPPQNSSTDELRPGGWRATRPVPIDSQ